MDIVPSFRGRFGKGYLPDTHDKSLDLSSRALFGAPINLPAEATLEDLVTSVYDQGQTSSCVGWAFAQAVKLRLAKMGTPIELPSPEAIYVCARAMERQMKGLSPSDSPLQDQGSIPALAVAAMQKWGIASMAAWPFDPATINDEPDLEELEVASAFQLLSSGYARITSTGTQRLTDIKQAIANGYPVAIGIAVDHEFEQYNGKGLVTAPNPGDILGGHMMHLVGYRSDNAFRGVNQWGNLWGDSGLYWADSSFVTSDYLTDAYVLMIAATGHVGSMRRKEAA